MLNNSLKLNKKIFDKDVTTESMREGFGHGLVIAGEKNKNVVALCADLTDSLKMNIFKDRFPNRFIEIGIAEQNMVTVASGLASCSKIPFCGSYAVFSPGRNWEQIRTSICYNNVPVKIIGSHAGLNTGPDGATHQCLEDIALMRVLPNMVVEVPCDYYEAMKATVEIAFNKKPSYLRLERENSVSLTSMFTPFDVGKAYTLWEGEDPEVLIIGCGSALYECLLAAKELEKEQISVIVLNNHTIKPMDEKTIIYWAKKCIGVVTIEDHQIYGGMGSAVCELLASKCPKHVKMLGVDDNFGESGTKDELYHKYHLTSKDIILAVREVIRLKKKN